MRLSLQLLVFTSVVVICVATYYLPAVLAGAGWPAGQVLAAAALGSPSLAVAAVALALLAWRRSAATERRLLHFARLVDGSLREGAARAEQNSADLGVLRAQGRQEPTAMVAMEQAEARAPERLSERPVLVAANDQQTAGSMPLPIAADQGLLSRFAEPLRRAAAGDLAISLQSIVSAQGSAAVAYEVHFRLNLSTGESRDFRRLPGIEQAALERLLLVRAADTARAWPSSRRPAPLHVPISDALLSNGLEFAVLLTMLSEDPALGDVLVPSMPAACLSAAAGHIQALELLAAAGMLLAIEGRPPVDMPEAIRGTVAYVKLPAGTLLTQPIQPQWETQLIATDVESEGERARLAALGLKLMTGHAVSGPCSCAMPERQQAAPMVNRL